jgi:phage tail protein X
MGNKTETRSLRVKAGDTWYSLASRHYGRPGAALALMRANPGVQVLAQGMWLAAPDIGAGADGGEAAAEQAADGG